MIYQCAICGKGFFGNLWIEAYQKAKTHQIAEHGFTYERNHRATLLKGYSETPTYVDHEVKKMKEDENFLSDAVKKLYAISENLRKMAHVPECKEPYECPYDHAPCAEKLSTSSSLAWECAYIIEKAADEVELNEFRNFQQNISTIDEILRSPYRISIYHDYDIMTKISECKIIIRSVIDKLLDKEGESDGSTNP